MTGPAEVHVYDQQVANHYAAYRPDLHEAILEQVLASRRFASGLDIGCGTGQSACALAERCETVLAVDNSAAMLGMARAHPRVTYRQIEDSTFPMLDGGADVVTMAGVLPYLDRTALLAELRRVGRKGALLVVYDFRVDLSDAKERLELMGETRTGNYDHAANLTGETGVETDTAESFKTSLHLAPRDVTHLILSNGARYRALVGQCEGPDLSSWIEERLSASPTIEHLPVRAWYAVHRFA